MPYRSQQSVASREAAAAAAARKSAAKNKKTQVKVSKKPAPRKTYAPPAAKQQPPKPRIQKPNPPKLRYAPKPAPKPAPRPKSSGTSTRSTTSSRTSGTTSTSSLSSTAKVTKPKIPSKKEWRASDSAFVAEQASIEAELQNILNQIANQRTKINADYGETYRNLGLRQVEGSKKDDWSNAVWDRDNLLGAYGQSMNNQVNDFAARGLLDSGLYTQELGTLTRGFDQQRGDLARGQGSAIEDLDLQRSTAQTQRETALNRARAESAARRAAAYGLTGV